MANEYSVADLLDFLSHAGDRGLMPVPTAQALAVAVRNVFGVLDDAEHKDLREVDLDATIKRFNNKRGRDFNPNSLKEYGRRVRRAVDLYTKWVDDPAAFPVKTRTQTGPKKERATKAAQAADIAAGRSGTPSVDTAPTAPPTKGGYQSAFPVRPGHVVTILNIPEDLTSAEAERLAQFVRILAVQ